MKFLWPTGFDIPDAIWVEAGMIRFRPAGLFYRCAGVRAGGEGALTLSTIEPPVRGQDIGFFDEARLRRIFRGFVDDKVLPPIEVFVTPNRQHRYRVRDGYHRFYASAAVGFPCVPTTIVDPPSDVEISAAVRAGTRQL